MNPFQDSTMTRIDAFRAKVAFLDPHLERPKAGQGKADFWARGLPGECMESHLLLRVHDQLQKCKTRMY